MPLYVITSNKVVQVITPDVAPILCDIYSLVLMVPLEALINLDTKPSTTAKKDTNRQQSEFFITNLSKVSDAIP